MHPSFLFGGFFQIGYVARDVNRAVENMKDRMGIAKWQIIPFPPKSPINALAFAYVNDVMLELIEVDPGNVQPAFANHVPENANGARLHHFGFMIDSEDQYRSEIARFEAMGFRAALNSNRNGIMAYYADTVDELGHYCELVHLQPSAADFFANVPRN